MNHIHKSIFATNIFAEHHPDLHLKLWKEFEAEVPESQRTGYYGSDNVAYVKYLKQKKDPTFLSFIQEAVESRTT